MSAQRKIKIQNVSWRDGRPRFNPGTSLRERGFTGTDLRHPEGGRISPKDLEPGTKNSGDWFTPGEAMDWSTHFLKKLSAAKVQEAVRPKGRPSRATAPASSYPVARLIADWRKSPEFLEDKAAKTQVDYINKMRVIEQAAPDIWAAEIDALDRTILFGLYSALRAERGLATARSVVRILSSAMSWGLDTGKFKILSSNPAQGLRMKSLEPRVRFATRAELAAFVNVSDFVGLPELGDSYILAVWSGQRQSDRLAFKLKGRVKGRLILRQSKTGAIVSIKEAPELASRLSAASARREAASVVSPYVILFEKTWTPWKGDNYRHYYSEIRMIVAHGLWRGGDGTLICPVNKPFKHLNVEAGRVRGECIVAPVPSAATLRESDFRDTAVTWLALAGSTIPEICSVTGHSVQSATMVLKHYLASHPEMADSAIDKMVAWYDDDGETEIGL